MKPIRAVLEGWPPSVNGLYVNVTGVGRVLSSAGKAYKKDTLKALGMFYSRGLTLPLPAQHLRLEVWLYGNWFTKAGEPKKADASNRVKALEDVLSEWLGVDDRWFWSVTVHKVQASKEETEVTITPMADTVEGILTALSPRYAGTERRKP